MVTANPRKARKNIITQELKLDILHAFKDYGFDPLKRLLEIYERYEQNYQEGLKTNQRFLMSHALNEMSRINIELLKYIYPTKKAVMVASPEGQDLIKNFATVVKQVRAEMQSSDVIEVVDAKKIEC